MTDQQFQDLVFRLETALSNLAVRQDSSSSTISNQLNQLVQTVESNSGDSAAGRQAKIFVSTLNRDFNFNALSRGETPDQIGISNQVYISGISPAVKSILQPRTTRAIDGDDPLRRALGGIPILGGLFEGIRSVVSFFTSPANLLSIGGLALAFNAFSDFMNSPQGAFFKQTKTQMVDLITNTVGKIIGFFTGENLSGADVKEKLEGVFSNVTDFWQKYIFEPSMKFLEKQYNEVIAPLIERLSITILESSGLPTRREDWGKLLGEAVGVGIDQSILGAIGNALNAYYNEAGIPSPGAATNQDSAAQGRLDQFVTAIQDQTTALCECISTNRPINVTPAQTSPGPRAAPANLQPAAPRTGAD